MNKKMITTQELEHYLNTYLNPHDIQENSYNGIQVTNTAPISKIATAVSASLEVIKKTAELGANALIVHHGIFCKNDPHPLTGTTYEKVKLLIKHDIALLCYHLPLDAHQEVGNNWQAARDLGLQKLEPFGSYAGAVIGVIGSIAPTSFAAFKEKVENYYGRPSDAVKVKDSISRIAIISGGAEKMLTDAAAAGADCFITGRVDEPVWDQAHEEHISFLALGHYSTETVGPQALGKHIEKQFKIPNIFISSANPF